VFSISLDCAGFTTGARLTIAPAARSRAMTAWIAAYLSRSRVSAAAIRNTCQSCFDPDSTRQNHCAEVLAPNHPPQRARNHARFPRTGTSPLLLRKGNLISFKNCYLRGSWRGKEMPESIISQGDLDYYEKYKDVIENFLHLPGYSEERKTSIRNIPHLFEFKRMNYQEKFTRELDEYWERYKHLWS
jgi:hypothetical protein